MPTGTWTLGWASGDLVTAAEFKKGIGAIYDTTLGASAAQVDYQLIPQTYAHLLLVAHSRVDTGGGQGFYARFNFDVAANYDWQQLRGTSTAASAVEAYAQSAMLLGITTGPTAPAGLFATMVAWIPFYAGTAANKTALSQSSLKTGTTPSNMFTDMFSNNWRSSAAINQVTVFPIGANFVAGTRVTLYAMGA